MIKIIGLFIFSLLLLSDTSIGDGRDKYMFPDAFMKDNDLVYDKIDVVIPKPKKKKEIKKHEPLNMGTNNIKYVVIEPMKTHLKQNIKPMTLIYVAPTFIKRKDINLVGVGLGFLINDWLNTELLVETSLSNKKLQLYDITNEYTINILGTKYLRANLLSAFSTGGILDKEKQIEKFFFAYGAGAEIELVMDKVKIVGAYKFEVFERKDIKAVKSNIYSVKIKFNFPF